jgi:hypothetical protein
MLSPHEEPGRGCMRICTCPLLREFHKFLPCSKE